jgi:hypothetical protein
MTFDLPGIKDSFSVDEMGPQHIAPMVAFLASDLAAKITGVTFGVDGNQIYQYKMMTSHGAMKRGSKAPWTIEEISQSIDRIMNWSTTTSGFTCRWATCTPSAIRAPTGAIRSSRRRA